MVPIEWSHLRQWRPEVVRGGRGVWGMQTLLFALEILEWLVRDWWPIWGALLLVLIGRRIRRTRPRHRRRVVLDEMRRLRMEGAISPAAYEEVRTAYGLKSGEETAESGPAGQAHPRPDWYGRIKLLQVSEEGPKGQAAPVLPMRGEEGATESLVCAETGGVSLEVECSDAVFVSGPSEAGSESGASVRVGLDALRARAFALLHDERVLRGMLHLGAILVLVGALFFAFVSGRFWLRLTVLLTITVGLIGLGGWVFKRLGDRIAGRVLMFTGSAMIALDYLFLARATQIVTGRHLSIAGLIFAALYLLLWRALRDPVFAYAWNVAFIISAWLGLGEWLGAGSSVLIGGLLVSSAITLLGTTSAWRRWARDCGEMAMLHAGLGASLLVFIAVGPWVGSLGLPTGHLWRVLADSIDGTVLAWMLGIVFISLLWAAVRTGDHLIMGTLVWLPMYAMIWAIRIGIIGEVDRLLLVASVVALLEAVGIGMFARREDAVPRLLKIGAQAYAFVAAVALLGAFIRYIDGNIWAGVSWDAGHAARVIGAGLVLGTTGLVGWPAIGLLSGLLFSHWVTWTDVLPYGGRIAFWFVLVRLWWWADLRLGRRRVWTPAWTDPLLGLLFQAAGWAFLVGDIAWTFAGSEHSLLSWWASLPLLAAILPSVRTSGSGWGPASRIRGYCSGSPWTLVSLGGLVWWIGVWDRGVMELPTEWTLVGAAGVVLLFPLFGVLLAWGMKAFMGWIPGWSLRRSDSLPEWLGFPVPWLAATVGAVLLIVRVGDWFEAPTGMLSLALVAGGAWGAILMFAAGWAGAGARRGAEARTVTILAWIFGSVYLVMALLTIQPWGLSSRDVHLVIAGLLWIWALGWMIAAKRFWWHSTWATRPLIRVVFLAALVLAHRRLDDPQSAAYFFVCAASMLLLGIVFPSVFDGWTAVILATSAWAILLDSLPRPHVEYWLLFQVITLVWILILPGRRWVAWMNDRVWRGLGYGVATVLGTVSIGHWWRLLDAPAGGAETSWLWVVYGILLFAAILYRECRGGGVVWVWSVSAIWMGLPFTWPGALEWLNLFGPGWVFVWILPLGLIAEGIGQLQNVEPAGVRRSQELWRFTLVYAMALGLAELCRIFLVWWAFSPTAMEGWWAGLQACLFFGALLVALCWERRSGAPKWAHTLLQDIAVPVVWVFLMESMISWVWPRVTTMPYRWGTGMLIGMALSLAIEATPRRWIFRSTVGLHVMWLGVPLLVCLERLGGIWPVFRISAEVAVVEWLLILAAGWMTASVAYRRKGMLTQWGRLQVGLALWAGAIAVAQRVDLDPAWHGVAVAAAGGFLSLIWIMGRRPSIGWTRERWIQPVIEPALLVASIGAVTSLLHWGADQVAISAAIASFSWLARAVATGSVVSAWASLGASLFAFAALWASVLEGVVSWPVGGLGLVGFYYWWISRPMGWVPEAVRGVFRTGFRMVWTVYLLVLGLMMVRYGLHPARAADWYDLAMGFAALTGQAWVGSNVLRSHQLRLVPLVLYAAWCSFLWGKGQSFLATPDRFCAPIGGHMMFLGWRGKAIRHLLAVQPVYYRGIGVLLLLVPITARAMLMEGTLGYPLMAVLFGLVVAGIGYWVRQAIWVWAGALSSCLIVGTMLVTRIEWQGGQWALVTAVIGVLILVMGAWLHQRLRRSAQPDPLDSHLE